MKRLVIIVLLLLFGLQLTGQSITPNIGQRLTNWCNSQDGRMATALNILREKYPNSDNLLRKVDNFENSKEDTKYVLLSLYRGYGADWAYTAIHDYFTPEQISIIEQLYIANGGFIKKERTNEERKRLSNLALKRGITTDMANRTRRFCHQNTNFRYFVNNILEKNGVSVMGSCRIIDNLSNNLDYVEEILFGLYDTYGADRAYYTIKEFLTTSQINALDELYDNWGEIKKEKKKKQENQKQIAIQYIIDSIHNLEPVTISEYSPTEYQRIKNVLISNLYKCLENYQSDNYSIKLSDDVLVDPNEGTLHTISITVNPPNENIANEINKSIASVSPSNVFYTIKKYNHSFPIKYKDHFEIQYDYTTEEEDLVISYKIWDEIVLKKGNAEVFRQYFDKIKQSIIKRGAYGRNRIKVKTHFINGNFVDLEIIYQ